MTTPIAAYAFLDFLLDVGEMKLYHPEGAITFTGQKLTLLIFFLQHPNKRFDKTKLAETLAVSHVPQLIKKLRYTLGDSDRRLIENVPGENGYRLNFEPLSLNEFELSQRLAALPNVEKQAGTFAGRPAQTVSLRNIKRSPKKRTANTYFGTLAKLGVFRPSPLISPLLHLVGEEPWIIDDAIWQSTFGMFKGIGPKGLNVKMVEHRLEIPPEVRAAKSAIPEPSDNRQKAVVMSWAEQASDRGGGINLELARSDWWTAKAFKNAAQNVITRLSGKTGAALSHAHHHAGR
jgi:DNA-binding winged helix-turn-helix (wHTH) protein